MNQLKSDLPHKEKWIIVGSGPSAPLVLGQMGPSTGIITLNAELCGIPYSTVHFFGHYEYYLPCINYLDKAEIVFFANPMHIGFRCAPIAADILLDYDRIAVRYPDKFRFFRKENDVINLSKREDSLYCRDTMASTAAHLLSLNGIQEAFYCGIDGHEMSARLGRSRLFEEGYKANDELNQRASPPTRYDDELRDFLQFSEHVGVKMTPLSKERVTV